MTTLALARRASSRRREAAQRQKPEVRAVATSSALGWLALAVRDDMVTRLVFGFAHERDALRHLGVAPRALERPAGWLRELLMRLEAYANGEPEDFRDVPIDEGSATPFARAVVSRCRAIGYGQTRTYGEVASLAGRPGAARAVGQVMASNSVPLVVPCHRVVAAGGLLGGFSAPQGLAMKRRLLALEAVGVLAR